MSERNERNDRNSEKSEFIEKVVRVNRVAKVVKGGRRFSFSALVVVGDGKGRVGIGLGKAGEVTEAIRKGTHSASRSLRSIVMVGTTVPHDAYGHFGAGRVIVRPAPKGHGVIAAGAVRSVMEAAGIHDITVKSLGSRNPHNLVRATLDALFGMRSHEEIAERRGMSVEQLKQ